MSAPDPKTITQLLKRINNQDAGASSELYDILYQELKKLASGLLNRERINHTLQATALVHEAYLKLSPKVEIQWQDRKHFLRAASGAMRAILVDHARRFNAMKRGGPKARRLTLDHVVQEHKNLSLDIIEIDESINKLGQIKTQYAEIVELHFFGGLTFEEISGVLETSLSTVERSWRIAKAWLRIELEGEAQ